MGSEPVFLENDVFDCPKTLDVHPFFEDNREDVSLWAARRFMSLYPSDLRMYLQGLLDINSFKCISFSIRTYYFRQYMFLKTQEGCDFIRVLTAKNSTKTNVRPPAEPTTVQLKTLRVFGFTLTSQQWLPERSWEVSLEPFFETL